jgi:hypothetical protein
VPFSREAQRAHYARNSERILEARRLKHFGMTRKDYDALLVSQGGVCRICGEPETRERNGKPLALSIDHDHACCPEPSRSCGRCVRGLLCNSCNHGLGLFRDNAKALRAAADYIDETRRAGGSGAVDLDPHGLLLEEKQDGLLGLEQTLQDDGLATDRLTDTL